MLEVEIWYFHPQAHNAGWNWPLQAESNALDRFDEDKVLSSPYVATGTDGGLSKPAFSLGAGVTRAESGWVRLVSK